MALDPDRHAALDGPARLDAAWHTLESARQAAEDLVLVGRARLTDLREEFQDRALGRARHAARRPDRVPFDQGGDDPGPFLCAQSVHTLYYA